MTGYDAPPTAGGGAADGPPLSLDVLADLHAGVLEPDIADEVRRQVDADPDAQATLAAMDAAIDATTAALARLPQLTMPENVAAMIDAALRHEVALRAGGPMDGTAAPVAGTAVLDPPTAPTMAPVLDFAAATRRRRRGLIAAGGLLTAAAAVFGVVAVVNLTGGETGGTPEAGATSGASDQALPPLAVTSDNLGAAFDRARSVTDYGPLGAPGRLNACLSAIKVDPAAQPLGAREVTLDGTPGVLLILPTGTAARFRLVVVEPECGPGRSDVLADTTIGR